MNQREAMERRERNLAISQRELEAAREDMEASRRAMIAALTVGMFVAFIGGCALGAILA